MKIYQDLPKYIICVCKNSNHFNNLVSYTYTNVNMKYSTLPLGLLANTHPHLICNVQVYLQNLLSRYRFVQLYGHKWT